MDPDTARVERGKRRRKRSLPNPERPPREKVDPSSQGPVDEIMPSQEEGQEGVGPGPRDTEKRENPGGEEEP